MRKAVGVVVKPSFGEWKFMPAQLWRQFETADANKWLRQAAAIDRKSRRM